MASKRPPAPSWSLSPLPDLPDDMLRSIGLIIVKHSILENLLQMLCYELAGVDEIVGRLMFREPRTVDRLNLLQELAKLQGIDISKHKISNLRKSVEVATNARDAVAHGLFFQSPDVWTFVGAAVIFGSAMYISHREAVRRAQIKTADTKAGPES